MRPSSPQRHRARRRLALSPRATLSLPQRRRVRRRLALSPSGEAEPPQRRRARRRLILGPQARPSPPQRHRVRWNQDPVTPVRGEATLLCVQKFLTFGGYWFHLLGYPDIRSPTVALEPLGDLSRTTWRVFLISSKLICRRVRASAPDGCSPRAPG